MSVPCVENACAPDSRHDDQRKTAHRQRCQALRQTKLRLASDGRSSSTFILRVYEIDREDRIKALFRGHRVERVTTLDVRIVRPKLEVSNGLYRCRPSVREAGVTQHLN